MALRPSLDGAALADLRFQGGTLDLWLENVRVLGVSLAGPLHLHGITHAGSREPRSADDAFPLQAPTTIRRSRWGQGELRLDCFRPTGQGEADEPSYVIGFTGMAHELKPLLGLSLRALTGFYPLRSDQRRQYPGPAKVGIAALNRR